MSAEKQTTIVLHTCQVANKGKAAKGTRKVATFGLPVLDKEKVAREFNYEFFIGRDITELYEAAGKMVAHLDRTVAFAKGLDKMILSATDVAETMRNTMADHFLALDIAETRADAENKVRAYFTSVRDAELYGEVAPTLESFIERVTRGVAVRKAKGDWITLREDKKESVSTELAPRLVPAGTNLPIAEETVSQ